MVAIFNQLSRFWQFWMTAITKNHKNGSHFLNPHSHPPTKVNTPHKYTPMSAISQKLKWPYEPWPSLSLRPLCTQSDSVFSRMHRKANVGIFVFTA